MSTRYRNDEDILDLHARIEAGIPVNIKNELRELHTDPQWEGKTLTEIVSTVMQRTPHTAYWTDRTLYL